MNIILLTNLQPDPNGLKLSLRAKPSETGRPRRASLAQQGKRAHVPVHGKTEQLIVSKKMVFEKWSIKAEIFFFILEPISVTNRPDRSPEKRDQIFCIMQVKPNLNPKKPFLT